MKTTLLLAMLISINSWAVSEAEVEGWADHISQNKQVQCLVMIQQYMGINKQIDAMVIDAGVGDIYQDAMGSSRSAACTKLQQVVVLTRHVTVQEALRMK